MCNETLETYEDELNHVCKPNTLIITMNRKELNNLSKASYMDGRHWNNGGGLNK